MNNFSNTVNGYKKVNLFCGIGIMRKLFCIVLIACASISFGEDQVPLKSESVNVGDISMHYKAAGDGVPIIFLHGGSGTSNSWANYLLKFADAYQTIAPDSRGQGRSSMGNGPLTYGRMANDVVKLLDYLKIDKAHVVGHSDGGVIALHLLIDYPDRIVSAVLLGTPYHIDNYPENAVKVLEDYVQTLADSDPAYDYIKSQHKAGEDPKQWATLIEKLGTMWRTQPTFSKEEIKLINTPVLIVTTDNDFFVPSTVFSQMASLIKDAKVKYLPNGTHSIYRKEFEEVSRAIRRFIQNVESEN